VALSALLLGLWALYVAHEDDTGRGPDVPLGDTVEPDEARAILARAESAADFVGTLLSFIEVSMAAISLALVAGAWLLRGMILDQAEETQAFVARAERELDERQGRLDALERSLDERQQQLSAQIGADLQTLRQQGQQSFSVLRLQLLAEQQVRAHNLDTAADTLRDALDLDPHNQATNYLLGYLYTQRKDIDRAVEHLERALKADPDFTPGLAALGLALRRRGDALGAAGDEAGRDAAWRQAEVTLLDALSRDPRLTDADGESYYGTLGGLYRRQKRYYAALDAYEQAHRVTPRSSYPITNLAAIHKHEGNDEQAAYFYQRVVEMARFKLDDDPLDLWARCDLAQARLALGEPVKALQQIQQVIEQRPERGLLEAFRSGLVFLAEAPGELEGLAEMLALVDEALRQRDADEPGAPGESAAGADQDGA